MNYEAVKYNSHDEALAAFKNMLKRKKDWIASTEADFKRLRKLAESTEQ